MSKFHLLCFLFLDPSKAKQFVKAGLELGYPENFDFNGESQEGFGFYGHTIHEGHRQSTSTSFIKCASERKNLEILPSTIVHKVLVENGKCVGFSF